ncbi:hypothetical protein PGT21_023717 [Puccinia graminis f. sp. tritici]|uniref:PARP-type domain-containing protein n=1 Tax=Puccinia graminis f. sp. tritici TaxID=56615 RepID=A0A5B0NCZ7_PUCGR|nr:hypothetical protein PGT21_023717 [Puccinia graminis f. sp. tritici]
MYQYRVEYSSRKVACTGCKLGPGQSISTGQIRFGRKEIQGSYHHSNWSHWGCLSPQMLSNAMKKLEGKIEGLHGLADLKEDDQMKVKNALKYGHIDPSDVTPKAVQKNKTANADVSGAIATVQEDDQNKITTHRRVLPRRVKPAMGGKEKDDRHKSKRQKRALTTDSNDESANENRHRSEASPSSLEREIRSDAVDELDELAGAKQEKSKKSSQQGEKTGDKHKTKRKEAVISIDSDDESADGEPKSTSNTKSNNDKWKIVLSPLPEIKNWRNERQRRAEKTINSVTDIFKTLENSTATTMQSMSSCISPFKEAQSLFHENREKLRIAHKVAQSEIKELMKKSVQDLMD